MAVKPAVMGKHTCHLNYTKTKVKIFVITQSHNNLDCRLNCPLLLKNDSIAWILGHITQMQVLLCLFKENVEDISVMYFGSRSGRSCWLFLWWVADVIALRCNFCFWCFIHILSHVYSNKGWLAQTGNEMKHLFLHSSIHTVALVPQEKNEDWQEYTEAFGDVKCNFPQWMALAEGTLLRNCQQHLCLFRSQSHPHVTKRI